MTRSAVFSLPKTSLGTCLTGDFWCSIWPLLGWQGIAVEPSSCARRIGVDLSDSDRAWCMGVITGVLERGLHVRGGAAIRVIIVSCLRGDRCGLIGGGGR
jgi:hypothetical protein